MEFNYLHPAVDLDKRDIEWLWRETTLLFDAYAKENRFNFDRQLTITTGGYGKDRREVAEKDLDLLFASGLVRRTITSLYFAFYTSFSDQSGNIQSLSIHLSFGNDVHVRISGTKEWIQRVRGLIDDFLAQRKSKNTRPRMAAFTLLTLFFPTAFALVAIRFNWSLAQVEAVIIVGIFFVALALWEIAKRLYPVPTLTIDMPLEWPWYVKWAHQILVTVVLALAAAVLASSFIR